VPSVLVSTLNNLLLFRTSARYNTIQVKEKLCDGGNDEEEIEKEKTKAKKGRSSSPGWFLKLVALIVMSAVRRR